MVIESNEKCHEMIIPVKSSLEGSREERFYRNAQHRGSSISGRNPES